MKAVVNNIPCTNCEHGKSIFCHLTEEEKSFLSEVKGLNYYKKGQTIFYEGNHAHGIFCLHDGKIKLSKLGKDGKEQIVRFAKTGEILGYRALLSNDNYQATATAMVDSYICIIPKDRFLKIMEMNSKLSLKLINLLSKDLKTAEQHLIDIAQKSVKERIAESLMVLGSTFGYLKDQKTLNISMTRSEIADMAGTTTESAIRTLIHLSDEKIIDLEGKNIKILKPQKLLEIANIND
ncbi:MAG: Crp/Fnr family transcriptional regulator [Flavobacteriia bacterium]|nr:Crp/Fnr family transcriptional regulator [Flavobacteriia bacterium]